jgi:ubiquinone/menaquinone biosynthesis C-methylase UbiE
MKQVQGGRLTRAVNKAPDPDLAGAIAEYYTQVGPDYTAWSRNRNMHFGVWRRGMSLFDREAMLEQMNKEVLAHGMRGPEPRKQLLDLGCGCGAVTRRAAESFPGSTVTGIALAPSELKEAIRRTPPHLADRVRFVTGNYLHLPFREGAFDMAFALESSCYAPGTDKRLLIEEAKRVLRPGGRLVIADAMLRRHPVRSPLTRAALRGIYHAWKLPDLAALPHVLRRIEGLGFDGITVDDVSRNTIPSALHTPAVSIRLLVRQLLAGKITASRYRLQNALVFLPLFIFGLDRRAAGYFIISGTRN